MKGAIIGAPPAVKYLRKDQLGVANGVAPLDDEGKLCTDNLPAALAELVEGDGSVAEHTHAAGDISSGIFGVPRGGTGLATLTKDSFLVGNGANAVQLLTAAQALSKMGAAASSHKHSGADITSGLDTLANSLSGYLSGAKIQTGSYTGTGTYGSANPCSLTFDFVPKMVIVTTSSFPYDGSGNGVCDVSYNKQFRWTHGVTYARISVSPSYSWYRDLSIFSLRENRRHTAFRSPTPPILRLPAGQVRSPVLFFHCLTQKPVDHFAHLF